MWELPELQNCSRRVLRNIKGVLSCRMKYREALIFAMGQRFSIKNSKHSAVMESYFQPERPMESAFPLYSIQSRKG